MNQDVVELSICGSSISDVDGCAQLTWRQVGILRLLASCYPNVASDEDLAGILWPGDPPHTAQKIIHLHIYRIRLLLAESGMRKPLIGTIRNVGFASLRPIAVVDLVRKKYVNITEDLLEDIAGLLETHQNRRDAIDLLSRLPVALA